MKRTKSISIVHAIVLAAGAAALGAAFSFLGATLSVLNRNNGELDTLISSSATSNGRIVSRTLRSTSVQTSVDCSGRPIQEQADVVPAQRRGLIVNPSMPMATHVEVQSSASISSPDNNDDQEVADKEDGLKVAWLMSFPNSGTSYTLHLIRETTNTTTATNYALEGDIKDEESVPAIAGSEEGPYLELIKTIKTTIPEKYILTKTHCGGFCSNCLPINYIETPRSFQISCLSGRRAVQSKNSTGLDVEEVRYSPDVVKKAVHVIRSPFNNVVARFHLEQKRHSRVGDTEWLEAHPNNKLGFQKWCADVDASNDLMEARWTDPGLSKALEGVPCHAEFFRYVQWHNLAFTTARDIGVPTFVLHYEDYRDRFEGIRQDLLNFLELPMIKEGPEFALGKEYEEFYTAEQREAVANLVKELASLETWLQMKDYYFASASTALAE